MYKWEIIGQVIGESWCEAYESVQKKWEGPAHSTLASFLFECVALCTLVGAEEP